MRSLPRERITDIHVECGHVVQFSIGLPLKGEPVYCRKCRDYRRTTSGAVGMLYSDTHKPRTSTIPGRRFV